MSLTYLEETANLAPGEGRGDELLAVADTGAVILVLAGAPLVDSTILAVFAAMGLAFSLVHRHAFEAGGELCVEREHGEFVESGRKFQA